jgi:hypothetical protein
MACCEGAEPERAQCCRPPVAEPLEVIRRDRDFVLNKWATGTVGRRNPIRLTTPALRVTPPAEGNEIGGVMSFDEALDWLRGNMFTVSGMAFMDGSNLDAERLKRCRVQYYTPDGRLIPFCAYNTMYRGEP